MGNNIKTYHRFLDEAGDTTFYGKGRNVIIGEDGVSKSFIIGMVKFKEPLEDVRIKINELRNKILNHNYLNKVPSIRKKIQNNNYYFHATDDIPEVRMLVYELIAGINCSFEAVVGRKIPALFEKKHSSKENEFYADLLSHLLKNKFSKEQKLVLNISERGSSTNNSNLQFALQIAKMRFQSNNEEKEIISNIQFNIQNHTKEPLLNIADYFCWSIQRIFERGEIRYYDYISDKVSQVIDLYDSSKYSNWENYYGKKNKLTSDNIIK
ncbi:MAG TPA: DUF3800 domain-containing protein [Candidatus Kapabacteria bacterium]|nr:DUF3800 domain-containing protein [Candidatus Kapabacteria bacterium]HPO62689.1 DUF3800 domain-containing protein [Candidatus Kapabacteria bacterium]